MQRDDDGLSDILTNGTPPGAPAALVLDAVRDGNGEATGVAIRRGIDGPAVATYPSYAWPAMDTVPACLSGLGARWVVWGPSRRGGDVTKVPLQAVANDTSGRARPASTRTPRHWHSYADVCDYAEAHGNDVLRYDSRDGTPVYTYIAGIGLVLCPDEDGRTTVVGIDVDHVTDSGGGLMASDAVESIVMRALQLGAYIERSPSMSGLHIYVHGQFPAGARMSGYRRDGIEIYGDGRYLTVTGVRWGAEDDAPYTRDLPSGPDVDAYIYDVCVLAGWQAPASAATAASTAPSPAPVQASTSTCEPSPSPAPGGGVFDFNDALRNDGVLATDTDVLHAMYMSRHGAELQALYEHGYPAGADESAVDIRMAGALLFFTSRDTQWVERLMRASALATPERVQKWDSRRGDSTWLRAGCIDVAAATCTSAYGKKRATTATTATTQATRARWARPSWGEVVRALSAGADGGYRFGALVPLDGGIPYGPELDTSCLPPRLRAWVDAAAASIQVPPLMAFAAAISTVAVAAQRRHCILVAGGWTIPCNLYSMCLMGPGNRKSAVIHAARAPLDAWRREHIDATAEQRTLAMSRRKTAMARIEALRGRAAKAKEQAEADELQSEIEGLERDMPPSPGHPVRLYCAGDATPEAVAVELMRQHELSAIMADEGAIIDMLSGLYNGGAANLSIVLNAWRGEYYCSQRRTADEVELFHPLMTLCLCIQPAVLASRRGAGAMRGRGFDARFLYFLPESMVGRRVPATRAPQFPREVRADFEALVRALLPDPAGMGNTVEEKFPLWLSADAVTEYEAFALEVERDMLPLGSLFDKPDWGSKLVDNTLRLAALFHLCTDDGVAYSRSQAGGAAHSGDFNAVAGDGAISVASMQAAIYVARLSIQHIQIAYTLMGTGSDDAAVVDGAQAIEDWLLRHPPADLSTPYIVARADMRRGVRRIRTAAAFDDAVAELKERNYLVQVTIPPGPTGGPSAAGYEVNRELYRRVQAKLRG